MKDIWAKLNTIADGTKFRRTFQHACSKSAACKRQSCREATESTTDNKDRLMRRHEQILQVATLHPLFPAEGALCPDATC
jgi:hypothetical protein